MTISKEAERRFCFAVIILSLVVCAGIKLTDRTRAGTNSEANKIKQKQQKNPESKLIKAGLTKNVSRNHESFVGEILIKTKTKTSVPGENKLKALALAEDIPNAGKTHPKKWRTYRSTDGKSLEQKIKEIKKDPAVEYAQPNYIYDPAQINTNDSLKDALWNLDNDGQTMAGQKGKPDADIDAPESWSLAHSGKQIVVAVIDTGIAFNHPDLAQNMWDGTNCKDENGSALGGCQHGYDFEAGDKIPLPDLLPHGTMVAGTLGAVKGNGRGVIGADPSVKIMALKTNFTTAQLVRAIDFAKYNGADVINASWGAGAGSCSFVWDRALYESIRDFPGLFVAAAGNNGRKHNGNDYFFYPADYSHNSSCWSGLANVVSVSATNLRDELSGFSDYGEKFVDLGAPGENVATSYVTFGYPASDEDGREDLYATASGTSFAAPHVSGVAALAMGQDNSLSARKVKTLIMESGDAVASLAGKTVSGERLNAYKILSPSSEAEEAKEVGETNKLLSDVVIAGTDNFEISTSPIAFIVIENDGGATHFSLATKPRVKKKKWIAISERIPVRLKKNKKVQNFFLTFRDANGLESQVFQKSFRYSKMRK